MTNILTSINPPNTINIFSGEKIIEWRKSPLPIGTHHVYETKNGNGCGLVIGTMEITRNYFFNNIDEIPEYMIEAGCVPREILRCYVGPHSIYANVIFNAKRFDVPKKVTEYFKPSWSKAFAGTLRVLRPPQAWMYVDV